MRAHTELRGSRAAGVCPPRPASLRTRTLFAAGAAVLFATALVPSAGADSQCVLVRERGGPLYAPHFVLHFGDPSGVPLHIQCATAVTKDLPEFCVPLYAYNLWEGAAIFEFAVRTPIAPVGFDRGPDITNVEMDVAPAGPDGVLTSLRLAGREALCGPVFLGCLRLPTAPLPESFVITLAPHRQTERLAARSASGTWRAAVTDFSGARIAPFAACPSDACPKNRPITGLAAVPGERAGWVNFEWTNGSGSLTLLRYRMDGRPPADPWDGEFLAFLPASVHRYTHVFPTSGNVHVAAWSITRGAYGNLHAASNIECGAVTSILVEMPVGVAPSTWTHVKGLYR